MATAELVDPEIERCGRAQMRAARGQMGPKFCRCGIGNVGRVQQSRVVKTGCAGPKERTAANMHTRRAAEVVRIVGEGERGRGNTRANFGKAPF